MASSLFPPQPNTNNSILAALQVLKGLTRGNSQALFSQMYRDNAEFRQFADTVRGKSPEQAFREHGLDYTQVQDLL